MNENQIRKIYAEKIKANSHYPKPIDNSPPKPKTDQLKISVLITGGIGDYIAIDPFCIRENKIAQIFLATRSHREIQSLINKLYPNINCFNLVNNFPNDLYCFQSLEHLIDVSSMKRISLPKSINRTIDYSINKIFPMIHNNSLTYKKSKILTEHLCSLSHLELPAKYITIAGSSNRDVRHANNGRNLTQEEYLQIANIPEIEKVCVFCQCNKPAEGIIHLKNTTVLESIEIVKRGCGYIGIDSWISVIGSWLFNKKNFVVKCINDHGINNVCCYWPFQADKNFIKNTIRSEDWQLI